MDFPLPILIAFVVIAIILGYFSHLTAKKRREEVAALAGRLGWEFDPRRDTSHDTQYAHFEIFRRGHGRSAFNTLTGRIEINGHSCPAKMGDFTYKITSGSGKSQSTTTYHFSYLIVDLPFGQIPDLLIRPEGIFDKMAGVLGFADINFESAEFSRRFFVKSTDKRFAYDVIHPRMMEFLLAGQPPAIDIEYGRCCLSDGSKRWSSEQFDSNVQWIPEFFKQWPEHLINRTGMDATKS